MTGSNAGALNKNRRRLTINMRGAHVRGGNTGRLFPFVGFRDVLPVNVVSALDCDRGLSGLGQVPCIGLGSIVIGQLPLLDLSLVWLEEAV